MEKGMRFFRGQRYLIQTTTGHVIPWAEVAARRPDMEEFFPPEHLLQATDPPATGRKPSGTRDHCLTPQRHDTRREQLRALMRSARLRRADVARICGVSLWTVIAWLRPAQGHARRTISEPALRLLQMHAERIK